MRILLASMSTYLAKNKGVHEHENFHHDEPVIDAQTDEEENIPYEEWAEPVVIL